MTDYYSNVYNSPEKFGLKIVKDLGEGGGYEWNVFVVWSDSDGNLYYGKDSGCSCNSPFEGVQNKSDLCIYEDGRFYKALMEWMDEGYDTPPMHTAIEALQDVRRMARDKSARWATPDPVLVEVVDREWEYRLHAAPPPNIDALDVFIVRYDLVAKTSQYAVASSQGDVSWCDFIEGDQILPVLRITGQVLARMALTGEDEVKAIVQKLKGVTLR